MDPITLLTTAIVAGAVAATQETTAQAVKDAYAGLKTLIASRFQNAKTAIDVIEAKPDDAAMKKTAENLIQMSGAEKDIEVLSQAQTLLKAVEKFGAEFAPAIGIDMKNVKIGASLHIEDVIASGTAVKMETVETKEDVIIKGVRAGVKSSDPNA
ncbi:MAG: hypothetical protein U0175_23525 [Caldilineaceae bacterium]